MHQLKIINSEPMSRTRRELHRQLQPPAARARKLVPLLASVRRIKVRHELDRADRQVRRAHIAARAALGLLAAQIRLDRALAAPRHIAAPTPSVPRYLHMTGERDAQLGLVHVHRAREVAAHRRDHDLVHVKVHDEVRQPPALRALHALAAPAALVREPLLRHARRGHARGDFRLLRRERSLHRAGHARGLGHREALRVEHAGG